MASLINADTTNGLKISSDTSGEVKIQSAGSDIVTVNNTGITMAAGKTLPAASLTGTLPAIDGSALTNLPASGPVIKYVTDSTDISVTAVAGVGYSTIGSTFSVDIPTSGSFTIKQMVIKVRNDDTGYANPAFGLRVGSTNYWFGVEDSTAQGVEITPLFYSHDNTLNNTTTYYSTPGSAKIVTGAFFGSAPIRDIVQSGIPTGTQTVQLITARPDWVNANYPIFTILGSSETTRVAIEFTEYS